MMSAFLIKKRYIYYQCANKKECSHRTLYREQDLEAQFEAIVRGVALAPVVVEWVKAALRSSLADETAYYEESVKGLTEQLEAVRRRMRTAYLDKVDGKITDAFWADCSSRWQADESRLEERLARHRRADDSYLEQGITLLSLAERVSELYASRSDPAERQRLLMTILEHCTIREGVITPSYRPPWDTIAKMAAEKKAPPATLKGRGRRSLEIQRWGG